MFTAFSRAKGSQRGIAGQGKKENSMIFSHFKLIWHNSGDTKCAQTQPDASWAQNPGDLPSSCDFSSDKEDGVERKPEWKYPTTEEHVHPQGHHLQGVCEVAGLPLPLDPWLRIPTCRALDFVFAPQFHLHNLIKICFLFIDLGSL